MLARSWFAVGGAFALCLIAAPAFAQPGGGGFGGFGGGGGAIALLANDKVVKELELVDDQVSQLKEIRDKAGEEMRGLFGRGGGGGNREEIAEKLKTFAEDTQKKIDKILLPNQAKRLKQLEFQQRTGRGGVTSSAAIEALGIADDQKETLTAKSKEVNDELAKKIAKLRADAQEELLKSLTPEQKAKYKTLAGEPFDFGTPVGFGGFGGAGGRGAGGRQGGGGRPGGNARPE